MTKFSCSAIILVALNVLHLSSNYYPSCTSCAVHEAELSQLHLEFGIRSSLWSSLSPTRFVGFSRRRSFTSLPSLIFQSFYITFGATCTVLLMSFPAMIIILFPRFYPPHPIRCTSDNAIRIHQIGPLRQNEAVCAPHTW